MIWPFEKICIPPSSAFIRNLFLATAIYSIGKLFEFLRPCRKRVFVRVDSVTAKGEPLSGAAGTVAGEFDHEL